MGSSGSRPRKITIENDNPMSVIKVSEDVVQRMKGQEVIQRPEYDAQRITPEYAPFLYEPSLTSIQVRQASVEALKENDNYWDKRIETLQKRHQQMQSIMEDEYNKAIKEAKGQRAESVIQKVPCVESRKQIIECYQKYRNEPMRCAKEVQEFAMCVDKSRAALITNV